MEAFPTKTALEVSKALLEGLIPQCIQRDNGPAFVSQITKGVSGALGITWSLHSSLRDHKPQEN